jgi:tetratricopeptide (TPR) repeat protein
MDSATAILEEARAAEAATDWPRAAEAYERALSLVDASDTTHQAELLTALGRCYRYMAEARPAWRSFMRAITLYREADNAAGVAQATDEALWVWCPPERRRQLAEDALATLPHGVRDDLRASLLLRLERRDEAEELAAAHDLPEVGAVFSMWDAWDALRDGATLESLLPRWRAAHETFASLGMYEGAADALRDPGFNVLARGNLDEGERLAREAWDYARSVNLRFAAQLAGFDVAGVAFCREQYDRCLAIVDELPGDLDFRGDIYRAHVASVRGDHERAMALMPSPDRAGGAPGPVQQVHAARGYVLWAAGRRDAAVREMEAWAAVQRPFGRASDDAPALVGVMVAAGDDALLRDILHGDAESRLMRYATLQGRGLDYMRGAFARRLGDTDGAQRHFREGLAWAEANGASRDARLCKEALGAIGE